MSNITWSKGTQLFSSTTDHAIKEQMIRKKEGGSDSDDEYVKKVKNKPNEEFFELIDTSALYDIKERLEMANIMHSNSKLYNAIILIESTINELKNIN